MRKIVIENREVSYPDPIAVKSGDRLILSGKSDLWDGHLWLWAEGPDGKCGWVPDSLVKERDGQQFAGRDYSAWELTCRKGEVLEVLEQTHGWAWCRTLDRGEGWVPMRNLSEISG